MASMTQMITDGQWEMLRQLGVKVPPRSLTKNAAGRLITYIKSGNGTLGKTPAERAAISRTYIEKFVGKRVYCASGDTVYRGRIGTVLYLRARVIDEVAEVRQKRLERGEDGQFTVSPFAAIVEWDATEKKPRFITPVTVGSGGLSLYYLQLI
ncbi:MAG TPA: hypothetical protein VLE93_00460 [Candidatus Saccharimonadales bacterium]|nr:hypothetical protein [Candidatus Saccharimonadales bacterium]